MPDAFETSGSGALISARHRLRVVEWCDLVRMRRRDGFVECLHPAPWLIGSWTCAALSSWVAAVACSFMFFLTALRLNHEAIHNNLGFSRKWHRRVLHGLSALMLGSNSAVAFNHLRHHAHLGKNKDVEGKCGRLSALGVLAYGPLFPIEMHLSAWCGGGPALRRRIRVDLALNMSLAVAAIASGWAWLFYHLLAMACAQCLTAFFAVWITHHDCDDLALEARTQRSRLINFAAYSMFFHLEHHLFPAVPVRRLAQLAARIDAAAPDIAARAGRVVAVPGLARRRRASSNQA